MTALLVVAMGGFVAYSLYIAILSGRLSGRPEDHLDAGGSLPAWGFVFAGAGIVLASLGLHDHFLLVALFGLQYSHVALGLVLVALCGALVQKRVWLAARILGVRSPVELFGSYYGSVTIRLFMLALLLLFAVPFAATSLATLGAVVQAATDNRLMATPVVWVTAFFLFLFSVIGGWRGVVYVVAAQSFMILVLLAFVAVFSAATFDHLAFLAKGIVTPEGILGDRIPGVLRYSSGLGKEVVTGGIWTGVGILSFALSLIGIVLSPAFSFLGITTATRSGFAFNQVWMTAGLAGGLLLLAGPLIGAEIAAGDPTALAAGAPSYAGIVARFMAHDALAAVCFLLLLVASLQVAVTFFAAAGANVLTLDLVTRYVLPGLTGDGRRLAARIALAIIVLAMTLLATFAPTGAAILGATVSSLSAQLLPAFLGLCWVPWISRSAVLTGLIVGTLMVVFTDPVGLIAFEGLFIDLPWGRWPLTIHAAAWGLVFNLAACLLVAIFTRSGAERDHRQRLHDAFAAEFRADFGSSGSRGAKWSLALIWAVLALGPGAILGNDFFSHPIFSDSDVSLGAPSLFVWQILFWFIGVLIVWWLAYGSRLSIVDKAVTRPIDLQPARGLLPRRRAPEWIALLLARVGAR